MTLLNILFCPSNSPRYPEIFSIIIQKHFSTAPKICILLFFYSSQWDFLKKLLHPEPKEDVLHLLSLWVKLERSGLRVLTRWCRLLTVYVHSPRYNQLDRTAASLFLWENLLGEDAQRWWMCSDVWWQPTFQGFRRNQQICWWRISVVCWSLFTVWWATTWEWSWSQENLNADIFFIKLMKSSINHHKSATCLFFLLHINLAVYSIYAMFVFSVFHQNKSKYPSKCESFLPRGLPRSKQS